MKLKLPDNIDSTALIKSLSLLVIGITIGFIINDVPRVGLNPVFSIGEITNLVVALFLAVYIQSYVEKKLENKRIEKDLLIEDCKNLKDFIIQNRNQYRDFYINGCKIKNDELKKIQIDFRSISQALNGLRESCKIYKNSRTISDNIQELVDFDRIYQNDLDLTIEKTPKIDSHMYKNMESHCQTYTRLVTKLILNINSNQ